jgi:DASS family divalent anion:Na+ symporter
MLIFFLLILWATSEWKRIDATVGAFIQIGVKVISRVITWDDILAEKGA